MQSVYWANSLLPCAEKQQILQDVRKQVLPFYDELKAYKESPTENDKIRLQEKFDAIFT